MDQIPRYEKVKFIIELKYLAYLLPSRITVARQLRNCIGFLQNCLKKRFI